MIKKLILPLILLISSVFLIQYHAIQFWVSFVGIVGIGWAILIEFAPLWLWSLRKPFPIFVAILGSFLALAGPMYHVSSPVIDDYMEAVEERHVASQKKEIIKKNIESQKQVLNQVLENSDDRLGWKGTIEETQDNLQAKTEKLLKASEKSQPANKSLIMKIGDNREYIIIMFELIGLIVLYITNIITVLWISWHIKHYKRNESSSNPEPPLEEIPVENPPISKDEEKSDGQKVEEPTIKETPKKAPEDETIKVGDQVAWKSQRNTELRGTVYKFVPEGISPFDMIDENIPDSRCMFTEQIKDEPSAIVKVDREDKSPLYYRPKFAKLQKR